MCVLYVSIVLYSVSLLKNAWLGWDVSFAFRTQYACLFDCLLFLFLSLLRTSSGLTHCRAFRTQYVWHAMHACLWLL